MSEEQTEQSNAPQVEQQVQEPVEEETPEMSVLTRTAHEARQGGWGQGNYRKKLLIDAGHNPYEVEEEMQRLQDEKNNK